MRSFFFVALLLGEGALRLRASINQGDAATGLRDPMVVYDPAIDLTVLRPNYEMSRTPTSTSRSIPWASSDLSSPEKPPRTVRSACLGASTTFSAEARRTTRVDQAPAGQTADGVPRCPFRGHQRQCLRLASTENQD